MLEFELKKWDLCYAQSLQKYANNRNVSRYLRNIFPYPYKLSDGKKFILDTIPKHEKEGLYFAIVIDGEAIGGISIILQDDIYCKSAEIGYWLGEKFWNQKIMSRCIKQVCEIAFNMFDIVRIFAEVFDCNLASQKVLEKSGFVLEGITKKRIYKDEKFIDGYIYGLVK